MPAPIPVRLFGEGITWFPRFSDVVVVANPYALQTTRAGERQRASAALEQAAPEPAPETEHPPKRQRVSECASASDPESRLSRSVRVVVVARRLLRKLRILLSGSLTRVARCLWQRVLVKRLRLSMLSMMLTFRRL